MQRLTRLAQSTQTVALNRHVAPGTERRDVGSDPAEHARHGAGVERSERAPDARSSVAERREDERTMGDALIPWWADPNEFSASVVVRHPGRHTQYASSMPTPITRIAPMA